MSSEKEETKKSLSERTTHFSEIYLAHHPISAECRNHVFKIGPLYLCVGCTSVITGFIVMTIIQFSYLEPFRLYPLIPAIITSAGVFMALLQLFTKPKKKLLKVIMRFSLGLGMGTFILLIVLVPNWYLKMCLLILYAIGTVLYNSVRSYSHMDDCLLDESKGEEINLQNDEYQLIDS